MYVPKIGCYVDFKRKELYVYCDNGEAEKITLDNEGGGVLVLDLFRPASVGALKSLIEKLNEILTKDQIKVIFDLWGNSTNIKTSTVTLLLEGDRVLAKKVIDIAVLSGVLGNSVNSTWKVRNKEEQKTMREYAEKLKRGGVSSSETMTQIYERMKKEGILEDSTKGEKGIEGEGEVGSIESSEVTSVINVEAGLVALTEKNDKSIMENIASGKVTVKTVEELQKELKMLQVRLDTNNDWNEEETPHTIVSKINKIKAQLRVMSPVQVTPSHTKVAPTKKALPGKLPARKRKP